MDNKRARSSTGTPKAVSDNRNAKDQQLRPSWLTEILSFVLCVSSPFVVIYYSAAARAAYSEGPIQFFTARFPPSSVEAILVYVAWLAIQAILYVCLPGPEVLGPVTPAGRRPKYRLNGLSAWCVTVALWSIGTSAELIDPAIIAKNWDGLIWTTTIFCFIAALISYAKACLVPGFFWYDFFRGVELHPRIGEMWDWKHFLSSRTGGIITWTMIDLSFAAYQYQTYGYLTNTMVVVLFLRGWVVVDYFINEEWFFYTLDGMYEGFGFYNIYGFSGMMPVLWTLQTQYLAKHPNDMSTLSLATIIAFFIFGWCMRFSADYQRIRFRQAGGNYSIWGKNAKGIKVPYQTADGKVRESLLLSSGWWGLVRHANYTGSCIYTWALCSLCGHKGIFVYTEAIVLTILVIHRCYRDEAKCAGKYGKGWEEYCRQVPWRMIPGIF
ncbi:ergosterol biosynthesis ERG4/ERG24 [Aspergillus pseudocaelatus]|uniref:7-dehydrocholesterol reductase n=1 Tax=Aspergillus pseudocaelatus TaxID=1825620 RepID=A0ABQ6W7Y6_9EURO|nr:ergosterol biosynthesis ERG4/ERG24 [Aspergillus pseudocaelatus]